MTKLFDDFDLDVYKSATFNISSDEPINELFSGTTRCSSSTTSNKKEFKTSSNYEVIYGLSGPLRYLLNFGGDKQMINIAEQIVDVLIERSKDVIIKGYRVPGWHYYPSKDETSFMLKKAPNGCINYGLSHGMAGPLAALSLAYSKGIRKEGLEEAINGLFDEFMNAYYCINNITYWPGRIMFEQYVGLDEIKREPRQIAGVMALLQF